MLSFFKERLPYIPETVGKSTGEIAAQRLREWEEQQELYREFDPEYRGVDWRSTNIQFFSFIRSLSLNYLQLCMTIILWF
jgi:hypothetical protein